MVKSATIMINQPQNEGLMLTEFGLSVFLGCGYSIDDGCGRWPMCFLPPTNFKLAKHNTDTARQSQSEK